jgi:hypothetical protein
MQANFFLSNYHNIKRITISGVKGSNWRNEIQQTIQVFQAGVWFYCGECESKGSYFGCFCLLIFSFVFHILKYTLSEILFHIDAILLLQTFSVISCNFFTFSIKAVNSSSVITYLSLYLAST